MGCLGQKEVVTAAHNVCIRKLLQEVDVHGKADRHMKLLTVETESRLGTLWDQEQCTQFCSKDELWEAAKEEEMKIPWKEAKQRSPVPEAAGAPDVESFLPCPSGTWSESGSPDCHACLENSDSPVASGSRFNCTCSAGAHGPDGAA